MLVMRLQNCCDDENICASVIDLIGVDATSSTASETWFHDSGPCLDICDTHDYDRSHLDLGHQILFMMMAMTTGHHEEFLRIDEILVIMMMAMMVLMVMTCIMAIMLMEVMSAMIIVMIFMMVIRLMMLVVVIAMMITLRTSQELTTSRSYVAPRRPCSHLLARTGSVFLCSSDF